MERQLQQLLIIFYFSGYVSRKCKLSKSAISVLEIHFISKSCNKHSENLCETCLDIFLSLSLSLSQRAGQHATDKWILTKV